MRPLLAVLGVAALAVLAAGALLAVRAPVDGRLVVWIDVPSGASAPLRLDGAPLTAPPLVEYELALLRPDDPRYAPIPTEGIPDWPPPAPKGASEVLMRVQIRGDAKLEVRPFVDLAAGRVVFEVLMDQGDRFARATHVFEVPGAPFDEYRSRGTSRGDRAALTAEYHFEFGGP